MRSLALSLLVGCPLTRYVCLFCAACTQAEGKALRAATRDAARTYGLFSSIGALEAGKLADVVLYPPGVNLLKSLSGSQVIRHVLRGGRVWDAQSVKEVWPVKGRAVHVPELSAD